MLWLKACPTCGGDLRAETDEYGLFVSCLQCARYVMDLTIKPSVSLEERNVKTRRKKARPKSRRVRNDGNKVLVAGKAS